MTWTTATSTQQPTLMDESTDYLLAKREGRWSMFFFDEEPHAWATLPAWLQIEGMIVDAL